MPDKYCFHLGREPELSIAELKGFFGVGKLRIHEGGVLLEDEALKNPQAILDQLGGTVKISRMIWEGNSMDAGIEIIAEWIMSEKPEGKLRFGLNILPHDDRFLNKTLKKIKQIIKNQGRNVRFVNKNGNLNTAVIVKSGLMKDGTDLNWITEGKEIIITQTVAIQNVHRYSQRDYEKPERLKKEGMLPPKLAQIMINLSGLVDTREWAINDLSGKILYDPFCGSGTILGEGLIKGMKVMGSDIDSKAVAAATKNLNWLIEKKLGRSEQIESIFVKDATYIEKIDWPAEPDVVVCETDLGPPQNHFPTEEKVETIHKTLIPVYQSFLKNLNPLLKPGTPLVIALPLHHTRKKIIHLAKPISKLIPDGYTFLESFLYHRKDQIVGREIVVLKR